VFPDPFHRWRDTCSGFEVEGTCDKRAVSSIAPQGFPAQMMMAWTKGLKFPCHLSGRITTPWEVGRNHRISAVQEYSVDRQVSLHHTSISVFYSTETVRKRTKCNRWRVLIVLHPVLTFGFQARCLGGGLVVSCGGRADAAISVCAIMKGYHPIRVREYSSYRCFRFQVSTSSRERKS
jgi:hypothetical protein